MTGHIPEASAEGPLAPLHAETEGSIEVPKDFALLIKPSSVASC